ncbi:hypothetical protein P8452_07465 [Trifolium repens]|nr:hypothetical protein P8452_07465 [Trifolium repens]
MKLWLSNTGLNPKRKFWKCRNIGMDGCDFLVWDDELEEVEAANPKSRTQQSKEFEVNVEVNNETDASPEKEIINVEDSGGKSQQAPYKGKEVANQVEVFPAPQQRLVVEKLAVQVTNTETVLSPVVSPRAILKNQDQQLEDGLNRDRLEDECSDDSNDSFVSSTQIHPVNTSAAIVTPEQRQTPVNVVKDMEFLKDSWANMAEEEDEVIADNNLVSPAHDDGFQTCR